MFEKEERKQIFENKDIPFVIIRKGNTDSILNTTTNKLIDKPVHGNKIMDLKSSNEAKFYIATKGRVLILNGSIKSYLLVDNKLVHTINNSEFNFFTLDPNTDYICISIHKGKRGECIFDINKRKPATPMYDMILPATDFPKNPLYKARLSHKESIFEYPSNKQMIDWFNDISSCGSGVLGGGNDYYNTTDEMGNVLYWKKWYVPVMHGLPEDKVNKILNDLKGKITNRIIIKRLFKVKL